MPAPAESLVAALHGFTGAGASWYRVVPRLPAGVRFLALHLPGHAGWEGELPSSFEATVDVLAEEIRRRKRTAHLLGYSLGARLGLGLLVRHPDLFESATLIGLRPGLDEPERRERVLQDERLADELLRDGLEAFVDRWERLPLFNSQESVDPELLAIQRRQRLRHDPEGLAWALRVLSPGRMPDYRRHLDAIRCPVHLMVGEWDDPFLPIAYDLLSPDIEVEEVADAGHNLPLEAPQAVARALGQAIERTPSIPQPLQQPA